MNSYTDVGEAYAELLLVTCLKRKTLRGIKSSSSRYVFHRIPCCLQYHKTNPKSVVYRGTGVGGGYRVYL